MRSRKDSGKREEARRLRAQDGLSLNEIARLVSSAKSSVSLWVRDVPLSEAQQERLRLRISQRPGRGHLVRDRRVAAWGQEAISQWDALCRNTLFHTGLGLYLGEGHKTSLTYVGVTNADPALIRMAARFFTMLGHPESRLKYSVYVTRGCDIDAVKEQCSRDLRIAPERIAARFKSPAVVSKKPIMHVLANSRELREKVIVWLRMTTEMHS